MVNYLAVLVASIATMVIGMVWYNPKIGFGKVWMKLVGMTHKDTKKEGMAKPVIINFIATLVTVWVLSNFITPGNVKESLMTTGWLWLGFVATISLGGVLWEKRPLKLWSINVANSLVSLLVSGLILAVWP
jgi:hypothetical protein